MPTAWSRLRTGATPMRRTASTKRTPNSSKITSGAARQIARETKRRGTHTSSDRFTLQRTITRIWRPSASESCWGFTPIRSSAGSYCTTGPSQSEDLDPTSDYSWKEMMAVLFSREIKDTDKVTSGAHTEIFFAATMLAQKTHAPNLKLQLGGSVTLCQVTDVDVPALPKTSTGYDLIRYAESMHDHPDTYLFYGAPGG